MNANATVQQLKDLRLSGMERVTSPMLIDLISKVILSVRKLNKKRINNHQIHLKERGWSTDRNKVVNTTEIHIRILDYENVELDNNLIENKIRPLALGRRIISLRDHMRQHSGLR